MVEDFVIRPLLKNKCEKTGQDFLSYVENHVMETVDWKEDESFEDILTDILSEIPCFCWKAVRKQLFYLQRNTHQEG